MTENSTDKVIEKHIADNIMNFMVLTIGFSWSDFQFQFIVMALDIVYIQPFSPRFSNFRIVGEHMNQFLNRELDGREAFGT